MAVHLRKYIENPGRELRNKAIKTRDKWNRRLSLTKEFLAGNYTPRKIEIDWAGKPLRSDLINALIEKNGYKKYLEIGCRNDACFNVIRVDYKVGVDPNSGGTLRMTSDAFFAQNKETFDIIFIDGLHVYEQVRKDIANSVQALNEGGVIIMHDCLPTSCEAQFDFSVVKTWNGDVWKAFIEARTLPDLDAATCLIDHGVGVIKKRKNSKPLMLGARDFKKLKYAWLADDYTNLLNAMDYEQALAFAANQ